MVYTIIDAMTTMKQTIAPESFCHPVPQTIDDGIIGRKSKGKRIENLPGRSKTAVRSIG